MLNPPQKNNESVLVEAVLWIRIQIQCTVYIWIHNTGGNTMLKTMANASGRGLG